MQTIMGSSAVRPLVGTVSARRSKVAAARVGAARGDRLAVVRSATLRVARTADDLGAAGSMTASARVLRSRVAAVMPTTGRSRRCVISRISESFTARRRIACGADVQRLR